MKVQVLHSPEFRRKIELLPLLVVASLIVIPTATSLPQRHESRLLPRQNAPPAGTTNETVFCSFSGDQDMYGLGIRVGYYIQWVATVFGAYFTPQMVSSAFEANAIFNIGMLAGLVYSTIRRNNMYMLEPLIVLGFSIGGAVVGLLDPKNVHQPNDLKSLRARMLHLSGTGSLYLPLLIYWVWYSFHGMDTMSIVSGCVPYTFMLAKIDARSVWFRYFMKSATVIAIVGIVALAVGLVVLYRIKSHELPRDSETVGTPNLHRQPRLSRTATALALRARPTKLQFLVVIVACVLCALSVELAIVWNNIKGVDMLGATGQLIPMAIGLLTSLRVCLGVISDKFKSRTKRRREREGERIFGRGGRMHMHMRPREKSVTEMTEVTEEEEQPGTMDKSTGSTRRKLQRPRKALLSGDTGVVLK
ncbi:hypothetical protein BDD12DRAFT_880333 [Trichophaea hybrida]|nr:hypothetical protein BDD12DRAFT_880333 [Trichophaea hybrida]